MRWVLIFLLFIPTVTALGAGLSPSEINVVEKKTYQFVIVNPNNFSVKAKVAFDTRLFALDKQTIDIPARDTQPITFVPLDNFFQRDKSSITVTFSAEKIQLIPQVALKVVNVKAQPKYETYEVEERSEQNINPRVGVVVSVLTALTGGILTRRFL